MTKPLTILITGASSGFGEATARLAAADIIDPAAVPNPWLKLSSDLLLFMLISSCP